MFNVRRAAHTHTHRIEVLWCSVIMGVHKSFHSISHLCVIAMFSALSTDLNRMQWQLQNVQCSMCKCIVCTLVKSMQMERMCVSIPYLTSWIYPLCEVLKDILCVILLELASFVQRCGTMRYFKHQQKATEWGIGVHRKAHTLSSIDVGFDQFFSRCRIEAH